MTNDTYARIQHVITDARAAVDMVQPRSEGDRKMLAAFDSLVLAVEMLNDELRRTTWNP